jgi:hypothetical protein
VMELAAAALVIPWALRRLPTRRSSWRTLSKGAIAMAGALTGIFMVVTVVGLLPSQLGSGDSGHTQSDSQDTHQSSPGH